MLVLVCWYLSICVDGGSIGAGAGVSCLTIGVSGCFVDTDCGNFGGIVN